MDGDVGEDGVMQLSPTGPLVDRTRAMLEAVAGANEAGEAPRLPLSRSDDSVHYEAHVRLFKDLQTEGLINADSSQSRADGSIEPYGIRITPKGSDWLAEHQEAEPTPSTSAALTPDDKKMLEPLIGELILVLDDPTFDNLPGDVRLDLSAQIHTLDAQLRAEHPKRRIVETALIEIHALALNAAGSVIGAGLVVSIVAAAKHFGGG
jgi:hypothetical protein